MGSAGPGRHPRAPLPLLLLVLVPGRSDERGSAGPGSPGGSGGAPRGSLWGSRAREQGSVAWSVPGVTLLCGCFADDELSLLIIVLDTNPLWWGKRALGEAEVRPLGAATADGVSGEIAPFSLTSGLC